MTVRRPRQPNAMGDRQGVSAKDRRHNAEEPVTAHGAASSLNRKDDSHRGE